MFEMRTQNTPAELANVRDHETCAMLSPRYILGRFWVVDHPSGKKLAIIVSMEGDEK
jgi:hypothetical protein